MAAQTSVSAGVGTASTETMTRVGVVRLAALPRTTAARTGSGTSRVLPFRYPYATAAQHATQARAAASLRGPLAASTTLGNSALLHGFLGLDAVDNFHVNAQVFAPPDQGLCAGPGLGGTGTSVLEMVNSVTALYSPTGSALLGPISTNAFFQEDTGGFFQGVFTSDPRCVYDAATHSWFAVQLTIDSNTKSHFDLAVDPTPDPGNPWTVYRIDTTDATNPNCPCFGDQPLLGIDQHGVYVSTNEFPIPVIPGFNGAQIYAISKKDLLSGAATPHVVHYGHLSIPGGFPAASLQPAVTPGSSPAEYFLSSLDPNATIDTRLGVWALTNEKVLDTGGKPLLSVVFIQVETYGQPPNAVQKGSSDQLQTDDDRMQQVQYVNGALWSSLDTVLFPSGDVQSRAGAAWFKIFPHLNSESPPDVASATVAAQGYVASKGNYLLYPAVSVNNANDPTMVMTLSGTNHFPSAVYATGTSFSPLLFAAVGAGPYASPSCSPCRWGDYSAAVRDPTTANTWLATEYIAPPSSHTENWATRVFEVAP